MVTVKVKKIQVGTLYLVDGRTVEVKPVNGKKFELSELQAAVVGYIEGYPTTRARRGKLWVNEDGLPTNLPRNLAAHIRSWSASEHRLSSWVTVSRPTTSRSTMPHPA